MLLPISTSGDDFSKSKQVFHLISYRLLFDYFFLQMTDGTSTSGYITAFNKKRRLLTGSFAKECCPQIWKWGVRDFECALHTDEVETFSCSKCPSETSPGDGLDEIHIGDGISEGLQMDNVPDYVKNFEEPVSSKEQVWQLLVKKNLESQLYFTFYTSKTVITNIARSKN